MKKELDYRIELYEHVIPFWETNSLDKEDGGFYTCLDKEGKIYDTDKFIWLQARQVWMFARLYEEDNSKTNYLNIAIHGAKFLLEHGRDPQGNWYFSLDKKGVPLVAAYNIFSDCFAAMAFACLYRVQPEKIYSETALKTFENILERKQNPKGRFEKKLSEIRPMKNFSLPMILSNLALEMGRLLDPSRTEVIIDNVINEIINDFYVPDLGLILENVAQDGSMVDSFSGRLLNPGHGLEAMWFLMDLAERKNDAGLMQDAVKISLQIIDYGWDSKEGGIFYFMDRLGKPPEQLEWDQKLWWVHLEAMVCMIKAYRHTGHAKALQWYEKLEEYSWTYFRDPNAPEWFGYLKRDGKVLLSLKGGKWKGCFHLPRALYEISKSLEIIEKEGFQPKYFISKTNLLNQ